MQRQAVLYFEAESGGVWDRARFDDGVDLTVLVGISDVEFRLEQIPVQDSISMKAGQGAHDVVRAEIMVLDYQDIRKLALEHSHFNDVVAQGLLGDRDSNRWEATA